MHRRTRFLAAAVALPLALAACGGSSETGTSRSSVPASSVTGTITYWDTSDVTSEAPAFQKLIQGFEAKYPNIKVNYVNVPFAEAQAKFKAAAQAGDAPDVMRSEYAWTPEFAGLGYLEPLDDTALNTGLDDYLPAALASNQFQGQLWGVPQVADAPALLCNSSVLQRAGVPVPKSWNDMKDGAAKVKAIGATFTYAPPGAFFTMPYLYSYGGDLLDTTTKKILVNDPQSVQGFQTALDLISAGAAVSPDPLNANAVQQQLFADGLLACVVNGPWSIAKTLSGPGFTDPANLTINPTPAGSQKGASPIGGHNYTVYAGSQNKDADYLFIEFMNSEASQVQLAETLGLLPSRVSAFKDVETSSAPTARYVTAFRPILDSARARPWIPELGQIFPPMDVEWIKMYTGQVTAQQGADSMAASWKTFLPTDYTD